MPSEGFEPTISAGERPKTYALDGAATGTDRRCIYSFIIAVKCFIKRVEVKNENVSFLNARQ